MMVERADRRVQKTKELLHEALLDLMIEKGYEAITIQNIIDRANVGRSTFYYHFEDKEGLLKSCIDQLYQSLYSLLLASAEEDSDTLQFQFSLEMLQHVQGHKLVYRAVVGKDGGTLVLNHMRAMLSHVIEKEVDRWRRKGYLNMNIPKDLLHAHILHTFWTSLVWWMNENQAAYTAFEVNQWFHDLCLSGIQS